MKKAKELFLIVPFLFIIFSISIANILDGDREISKSENRALQQMPSIKDLKDGQFSTLFENYYQDQFIMRDTLIKMDIKLKMLTKKSNVNGFYISNNGWIMGGTETYKNTEDFYRNRIKKLNEINKKVNGLGKKMYYVSLPHKVNTLYNKYPSKYINKNYGIENNKLFLNMLKKSNIEVIDVGNYFLDNFKDFQLEKFYFKTDHHWNAIGGFEGFKYIIDYLNNKKYINVNLDEYEYNTFILKEKDFLGSYNKNLYSIFSKKENIPYVYMNSKNQKKYF